MSIRIACVAVAATGTLAHAGLVFESEPNNTPGTANFIASFSQPGGSIAVDGTKTVGDVDWFEFVLNDPTALLISMIGSSDIPLPDTQLQLVSGDGTTILAFDDDDGPANLSALNITSLPAGNYFIGVSEYADVTNATGLTELFDGIDSFTGQPTSGVFTYKLSIAVNLVPAPASMALVGMGGFFVTRRRR